jgi:hypothetical protein
VQSGPELLTAKHRFRSQGQLGVLLAVAMRRFRGRWRCKSLLSYYYAGPAAGLIKLAWREANMTEIDVVDWTIQEVGRGQGFVACLNPNPWGGPPQKVLSFRLPASPQPLKSR